MFKTKENKTLFTGAYNKSQTIYKSKKTITLKAKVMVLSWEKEEKCDYERVPGLLGC